MQTNAGKRASAPVVPSIAWPDISVGADVLTDFEAASRREWLATNGIGGYASGSLAGANTRRYHALLVAALTPPTGRMTLLSRLEEAVRVDGVEYELASNQYPGTVYPQGYRFLERFESYPAPTFLFRLRPGLLLEKRIWMGYSRNTTYIRYTLREAPGPVELRLTPLVCWKDYHAEMHPWEGFPASVEAKAGEVRIRATWDSPILRLLAGSDWEPAGYWHNNIEHLREMERGLDWHEDLYCPGHFWYILQPGEEIVMTASIESDVEPPADAWNRHVERLQALLRRGCFTDDYARALALAADAFVIEGDGLSEGRKQKVEGWSSSAFRFPLSRRRRSSILAGYHWFADWGRDTMISLPGLCLTTGRFEVARDILLSFAQYVDRGMLPNRFPDRGETPEYNTVDATLWYFQAVWEYTQAAGDGAELARALWPTLTDILAWHERGTRYGISVDPSDGLLRAGEPGVQLTWMDAKVGDWVVTPRIGKPVEINALWYNALCVMAQLAAMLGENGKGYRKRAQAVARGFRAAFVRPDGQGLYDVIAADGQGSRPRHCFERPGPDASLRPNQIFAVSLPHSPLTKAEQKAVVATVQRALLTPYGLRTLAPNDPAYRPHYGGNPRERDSAYHQGTVWPWLLGPFALAHYRVYGHAEKARAFLEPLQAHLREAGMGSISEIFDAELPHAPNGCIAQAWSVAEILRAWQLLVREECLTRRPGDRAT